MTDILIVEDNKELSGLLCDFLRAENYTVSMAESGEKALSIYEKYGARLVVLDIMLPGMDGFAVCRKIREESNTPILIVSAKTEKEDKLNGLILGADDYIEKPFSPSVLVARVKAHLAQYARLKPCADTPKTITVGPLTADPAARRITKNGVEVPLKNKEYELLFFLMRHPEQVFIREDLY